ncbi:MAG: sterol carrier protein domain-containing protein [Haloferacaceae archaeon]
MLLDRVKNPADLEVTLDTAAMVRIVDVVAALEGVRYPATVEGETTMAVSDDLAPWNDDTYRLALAGGEATVEPTDDDPAVELDVGVLSQLLVGYRSSADLLEFGDARVHDDAGGEVLAAAFPEARVYVREWF